MPPRNLSASQNPTVIESLTGGMPPSLQPLVFVAKSLVPFMSLGDDDRLPGRKGSQWKLAQGIRSDVGGTTTLANVSAEQSGETGQC